MEGAITLVRKAAIGGVCGYVFGSPAAMDIPPPPPLDDRPSSIELGSPELPLPPSPPTASCSAAGGDAATIDEEATPGVPGAAGAAATFEGGLLPPPPTTTPPVSPGAAAGGAAAATTVASVRPPVTRATRGRAESVRRRDRRPWARAIVATYIDSAGDLMVNVGSGTARELKRRVEEPPADADAETREQHAVRPSMFDAAQEEIFRLLYRDNFARFRKSLPEE